MGSRIIGWSSNRKLLEKTTQKRKTISRILLNKFKPPSNRLFSLQLQITSILIFLNLFIRFHIHNMCDVVLGLIPRNSKRWNSDVFLDSL
ncbi:hypothetical protein LEP1GSC043_2459 [Leptospira weilii str. Ecochallenge]|uniref:Uncharacterized protein n=1 Tax=Leptospira weilii str. Ecochallenge TaxID=1049986 RepID=N1U8M2_9LEPT|nr:hypothetical protein LEP1GSC043_2459 [Leptospira weilii str. Ecochallenge]